MAWSQNIKGKKHEEFTRYTHAMKNIQNSCERKFALRRMKYSFLSYRYLTFVFIRETLNIQTRKVGGSLYFAWLCMSGEHHPLSEHK